MARPRRSTETRPSSFASLYRFLRRAIDGLSLPGFGEEEVTVGVGVGVRVRVRMRVRVRVRVRASVRVKVMMTLMCGGAVNRQPGYRARNLQRRGFIERNYNFGVL